MFPAPTVGELLMTTLFASVSEPPLPAPLLTHASTVSRPSLGNRILLLGCLGTPYNAPDGQDQIVLAHGNHYGEPPAGHLLIANCNVKRVPRTVRSLSRPGTFHHESGV